MTDKDIIKALEKASEKERIDGVVCRGYYLDSVSMNATIALINRQQAEIERLEKENVAQSYKEIPVSMERVFKIGCESAIVKKIEAEAVKEFITKAEESIVAMFNEHYYMGYETDEDDVIELLRNLVKEMVGEG